MAGSVERPSPEALPLCSHSPKCLCRRSGRAQKHRQNHSCHWAPGHPRHCKTRRTGIGAHGKRGKSAETIGRWDSKAGWRAEIKLVAPLSGRTQRRCHSCGDCRTTNLRYQTQRRCRRAQSRDQGRSHAGADPIRIGIKQLVTPAAGRGDRHASHPSECWRPNWWRC